MFNKKKFFKDIKVITLIAVFIFLLADINLFAKTNDQILAASSMEMSGYTGVYNNHYGETNDFNSDGLKQIMQSLENDKNASYKRQFFVLDKDEGNIIATGDVPSRVSEELNSQINEKFIVIENQSCKIVDFDHYKLLVKVDTLAAYDEYVAAVSNYALVALVTLLVAFALVALGQKLAGKREALRAGINVVLTLIIVGAFALEVLQAETSQLESIAERDKVTLQQNLDLICNDNSLAKYTDKEGIEEIGNSLANASATLKEVSYVGSDARFSSSAYSANETTQSTFDASKDIQITQDEGKLQNERTNFYIQAALLMLLAFILAKEIRDRSIARVKAEECGAADLTANDRKVRTILLLIGLATSCFGIVSVLRIRQVVMINWTDNVGAIIGGIFTATMVATIIGSLFSSAILKRCGSIKSYVIAVCALGVLGCIACGISNNVIIFVAGLLVYNIVHATSRMSDDFYVTLIDDPGRKDRCSVEFSGSKTMGEVVGTIAGGIISTIVSFAFVQILVGVLFLITVIYALRMGSKGFAIKTDGKGGVRETLAGAFKAAKRPNVALYIVLIAIVASIPYMLVQYKLPLDIAALGLSAVVLSFVKTLQEVVEIYSRPLFHVLSKRMSAVTHAAFYVVGNGAVALIYMMCGGSLAIIALSLALLGLFDGAAKYAITKAFRDLPDLSDIPESDRIVTLRLSQKAGDTISPPLLSIFSSGPVLPIVVMVLPTIYWIKDKLSRKNELTEQDKS